MDTTILEDLGLTKGEIKIYLTLLELGKTKVGQIIEKSKMASSAVHNSIHTLSKKGLSTYIKEGKIKFYKAVPPKQLLSFIEDKKKQLQCILPELESKQAISKEKQEAEVFQGTKGVIAMLNSLIEKTKRGSKFLFFAINIPNQNEEIQKFFEQYDAKRKDKGLIILGLAPRELKPLFQKRRFLKMKYSSIPIPSGISICNDKIAFYSWGNKPVGYLIKSKEITDMYKNLFRNLWIQKR